MEKYLVIVLLPALALSCCWDCPVGDFTSEASATIRPNTPPTPPPPEKCYPQTPRYPHKSCESKNNFDGPKSCESKNNFGGPKSCESTNNFGGPKPATNRGSLTVENSPQFEPQNQPFNFQEGMFDDSNRRLFQTRKTCRHSGQSSKFTLTLEYACRQHIQFKSCEGIILWNNLIVGSLNPNNYKINTFSVDLYAVTGENFLGIEGAGVSDIFGLTIDNVKLVREGTNQNIVVNGDFENPAKGIWWGIFTDILGWTGRDIEVGWGKSYNCQWSSQVCELDGHRNYQILQYYFFDDDLRLLSNPGNTISSNACPTTFDYHLEFDYAARADGVYSPQTSQGNVVWNNYVIASLVPCDYGIKHFCQEVKVHQGQNILAFDGTGLSEGSGLGIANVKLTRCGEASIIKNGNFACNSLGKSSSGLFKGGISEWRADNAEVGICNIYNSNWPNNGQNCIELDSNINQRYIQVVRR